MMLIPKSNLIDLWAFTYTEWVSNPDDRKSIGAYYVYFDDSIILRMLGKQKVMSCSSGELEYRVVTLCIAYVFWLFSILKELRPTIDQVPTIFCDSISTQYLINNPIKHVRTKHIKIDFYFVKKKWLMGSWISSTMAQMTRW